ncbi:Heterokaryon incompatibility protein [Colletotrichum higginsianum IMI 349063]|uniref:Heterokaryon incompatibility protein n=1 Tax=Colletotrichum higginsianum (strain IMI 349063) TaxID=759273 RepID=A0A1B7YN61_COLHI|nr:Heterokaryon incompatibility protein [Colletotrichum higginsianum IMI 349063]OBR13338.1 Heterokaryon incompatibility protein [Colletotrichum higginsianum IMI 349063]GJC95985.1 heterokaryon incompatibility protein [Colletotrichum higginsianum]
MSKDVSHLWVGLVNIYSRCQLTFPEDKPYAFSGVIKLFQELSGDVYLAGVWQTNEATTPSRLGGYEAGT